MPSVFATSYTTVGRAGDQLQVVFALQPLLHDVHVQQAQEADAETEAQRGGNLRLVVQRRVVEPQLGQRIAEILVVLGIHREHAGEHPRLNLLETRQRRIAAAHFGGDGVAHRRAIDFLDAGNDEAHLAGAQQRQRYRLGREAARACRSGGCGRWT